VFRIGFGYDVHRLVEGRKLILGGVEIPFARGLEGHSDADVLIHAIVDALLGSLALGDIGSHFSDQAPEYKNIDSRVLLRKAYDLVNQQGYRLQNLDCTICAQAPKLRDYIPIMRNYLATDLACQPSEISVKATTEEGLGVSGGGEGIAAYCVAMVRKI